VADDESEIEASRAPLLDHLIELRSRLIVCAAALTLGFLICFFFSTNILVFLLAPFERAQALLAVQNATGAHHGPFDLMLAMTGLKSMAGVHVQQVHMVFTAPLEVFFEKLKLSGFGAIVLTFPILAWQLYRFIAPGLYRRERHAFLPFLIASPVLFLMGAALVYFVMLPFVLWFSLNQQIVGDSSISVQLLPKVSDYLSLVTTLLLGLVSSQFLRSGRRYAILAVFVVAAVLTPPDPISMMSLAIPGLLLYEVSILSVWLIERRRVRDEAAEAAAS
jgi:sec-independent protein translocase protein TatC